MGPKPTRTRRLTVRPWLSNDAAHFAVAAFFNHDVVPFVRAFAALFVDAFDFCQAVFEHHAFFGEAAHLFGGQPAQYAHGVFAFDFKAGVGKAVEPARRKWSGSKGRWY